jgi:hypothetical protein
VLRAKIRINPALPELLAIRRTQWKSCDTDQKVPVWQVRKRVLTCCVSSSQSSPVPPVVGDLFLVSRQYESCSSVYASGDHSFSHSHSYRLLLLAVSTAFGFSYSIRNERQHFALTNEFCEFCGCGPWRRCPGELTRRPVPDVCNVKEEK